MGNNAALIYAAGVGSRMKKITENTSKCIIDLGGVMPIEHTIKSFIGCGIDNLIIVVGYYAGLVQEKIVSMLAQQNITANIKFVENNKYDFHGCEYSLACAHEEIAGYDTVYITEGDILLDAYYVKALVEKQSNGACLIRGMEYIDPERSVAACSANNGERISQFVYDDGHHSLYDKIPKGLQPIGDSMQMWKFSGDGLKRLCSDYTDYYFTWKESEQPSHENGLKYINMVCSEFPMDPVVVEGAHCINLNTEADVELAKKAEWLNRN